MTYKGFSEVLSDAKERVIFWKEKCALIEAENKALEVKNEKLVGLQKEIEIEKRGMAYDIHKLREAAKLLSTDMHYASMRPCRSCKAMTDALGEPYGCYAYQNRRKALEEQLGDD